MTGCMKDLKELYLGLMGFEQANELSDGVIHHLFAVAEGRIGRSDFTLSLCCNGLVRSVFVDSFF